LTEVPGIEFVQYSDEKRLGEMIKMIEKDLSEPYSIFTYRYFINGWPELCWLALDGDRLVGCVVGKLESHRGKTMRGYIAMLAVDKEYRRRGISTRLLEIVLQRLEEQSADECVLETEVSNASALAFYSAMGFIKAKRLHKYYLNAGDAFRLKCPLNPKASVPAALAS
jgi:peptide alpha-N-acetyltransferase